MIKASIIAEMNEYLTLKQKLSSEADLEVGFCPLEAANVFDIIQNSAPDIIVIYPTGGHQIKELVHKLTKYELNVKTIFILDSANENTISHLTGIKGLNFVIKDNLTQLKRAIREVHQGHIFLSDELRPLFQNENADHLKPPPKITENEKLLLRLICEGYSSRRIGEKIHKSPRTVEEYREKLYQKFGVKTKEEFIVKVVKMKLH